MRLLLVNPRFPESFWSFKWALDRMLTSKRAVNPPLGLATLAALTPSHWEIEIVDENIESIPLDPKADLIGVCGMGVQFPRQRELLDFYRQKGYFVVAGGSYASLCPEKYEEIADSVIAGEAEYIWKKFCADFELGSPAPLYQEQGTVALADSPTPRFDLLKLEHYTNATLQFSRGCPFLCEFCDIIVMFGRKPRTKSLAQVEAELDELQRLGATSIFFVDDNFIGDKRTARELLSFLVSYQKRHGYPFRFGTEVSLNLAHDAALLELFREAHFHWVFIGIESPDEDSLRETGKLQNTRENILTSVERIHSHGIEIFAGFIIGFDNDTEETFEKQFRFIMDSGIQVAMVGLLSALPKTPLYQRLTKAGRLRESMDGTDNTKLATNVIPLQMPYETMIRRYHELYGRLCSHRGIADRIRAKVRAVRRPLKVHRDGWRSQLTILRRFLWRGLALGEVRRSIHFLRSISSASLRQIPMVITDWVLGLAMRDYVVRNFRPHLAWDRHVAAKRLVVLKRRLRDYLASGSLKLSLNVRAAMPHLSFTIERGADRRLFRRGGRQLKKLLRSSGATVTLRIRDLHEEQVRHFQRLLAKLARYGDRVSIAISEERRTLVDSSVFHLVLAEASKGSGRPRPHS